MTQFYKKFFKNEKGISLLETIISIGLMSVIFTLVFTTTGKLLDVLNLEQKEIALREELSESLFLCKNHVYQSDLLSVSQAGAQLDLIHTATGRHLVFELVNSARFPGCSDLIRRENGQPNGKPILYGVLPFPQSGFEIFSRSAGMPLVRINLAKMTNGLTVSESMIAFPKGYI